MQWRAWEICSLVLKCRVLLHWPLQFIANALLPDHEADAFYSLHWAPNRNDSSVVHSLFGGYARWDAVHMLHISMYGYTYETNAAFAPLYPLTIRTLAALVGVYRNPDAHLLIGVLVNVVASMVTACALHRLVVHVLHDRHAAKIAVVLYATSPASIFLTACYSESLYSAITFVLLALVYVRRHHALVLAPLVALSMLCRTNGLLNLGYIAYELLLMPIVRRPSVRLFVKNALIGLICLLISVTPYLIFTMYLHGHYCTPLSTPLPAGIVDYGRLTGRAITGDVAGIEFCRHSALSMYTTLQAQHWNVFLFGYWKLAAVPLFLLATPVLVCVLYSTAFVPRIPLPMAIHACLISLICALYINVEVSTRLLFSSSPIIYMGMALHAIECGCLPLDARSSITSHLGRIYRTTSSHTMHAYLAYSVMYTLGGTLLHVNFMPWT